MAVVQNVNSKVVIFVLWEVLAQLAFQDVFHVQLQLIVLNAIQLQYGMEHYVLQIAQLSQDVKIVIFQVQV